MAGDERQPHRHAGARPWVRSEGENAFTHIPDGIVSRWDSGQVAYYPLKPHIHYSFFFF